VAKKNASVWRKRRLFVRNAQCIRVSNFSVERPNDREKRLEKFKRRLLPKEGCKRLIERFAPRASPCVRHFYEMYARRISSFPHTYAEARVWFCQLHLDRCSANEMGVPRIYFHFIHSKITPSALGVGRGRGDRKLAGREYGWISSRLRGATYWTKLAHIKQGSNWNSGGIRRSPRSLARSLARARALGSAGNGALGARSRARKRNPRLRIPLIPSRSPRLRSPFCIPPSSHRVILHRLGVCIRSRVFLARARRYANRSEQT